MNIKTINSILHRLRLVENFSKNTCTTLSKYPLRIKIDTVILCWINREIFNKSLYHTLKNPTKIDPEIFRLLSNIGLNARTHYDPNEASNYFTCLEKILKELVYLTNSEFITAEHTLCRTPPDNLIRSTPSIAICNSFLLHITTESLEKLLNVCNRVNSYNTQNTSYK